MPISRGKKFETETSRMLESMVRDGQLAYYFRPFDVPPAQRDRFTSRNPIDFYCYQNGGVGLVIECKAMKAKSLSFSRFADHQWDALVACARGGVDTFVLVNYYGWPGRDGQRGRVYAVPVMWMHLRREELTRKSWPLAELIGAGRELGKVAKSWVWGKNA